MSKNISNKKLHLFYSEHAQDLTNPEKPVNTINIKQRKIIGPAKTNMIIGYGNGFSLSKTRAEKLAKLMLNQLNTWYPEKQPWGIKTELFENTIILPADKPLTLK